MTGSRADHPDRSPVKRALSEILRLRQELERARGAASEPVAIVGLAHRLPGVDPVPDALHEALGRGLDAIADVPPERWDVEGLMDPRRGVAGKMYTTRGGFLRDVAGFEPEFFGISPFEASTIDPQQRLLLEVAWEALEHAAIDPTALRGSRTGVYVGIASNDYARLAFREMERVDAYASVGTAFSVAAGRLSYFLGVHGPAIAIDTACSSSLVAMHLACQALLGGECDVALVGGVNLIVGPEVTVNFCQAGMLAPDGRCKTFDASADGYVRSEGCGVVVAKRLSHALRDGDRVLAVVRGSALNQDGRSSGITAPNGPAQEAVIRAALGSAGLKPSDIGYVEAHGTGTSLGDPIEAQALGAVFGESDRERPLLVGSVKTNLGHLEAAAGVAGLIKVVQALQRREIPPHLHFHDPSPHIPWARLPLAVPTELTAFEPTGAKRRAGVSSFGFSGTNAHVVLEEAPEPLAEPIGGAAADGFEAEERPVHLLTLSAPHEDGLRALADRYASLLRHGDEDFPDVCHTANTGRAHFDHRLAIVALDGAEAEAAITSWLDGEEPHGLTAGRVDPRETPSVAFVFPPAVDLGWTLPRSSPVFRDALLECRSVLDEHLGVPILDVLDPAGPVRERASGPSHTLPMSVAVQHALCALWRSWGIEPDVVAGAGIGELSAACAAGCLALDDALALAAAIGRATEDGLDAGSVVEPLLGGVDIRPSVKRYVSAASATAPAAGQLADPSFWVHAVSEPGLVADVVGLLHDEGADRFVVFGPSGGVEGMSVDGPRSVLVDSVAAGSKTWEHLLTGLARLHVAGADPDWRAVDRGYVRRKVSLPTYPFQRRRFWLTDGWPDTSRPAADVRGGGASPSTAARTAASERACLAPLDMNLASYPEKWSVLARLAESVGRNTLVSLGAFADIEDTLDVGSVLEGTGIVALYRPIVERWLESLERADALERDGRHWRVPQVIEPVDLDPILARVEEALADNLPLLRYVRNAAELVQDVVTGRTSPLETLFPGGSFDLAADLYESAAQLRYINGIARSSLEAWIRARPREAPLRLLEIGAGTGGTTSSLIPVLPSDRSRYDYTDVSEVFLDWGREKFADVAFLEPRMFDLELDPSEQGIQLGGYDVVVASNVLHAARDVRAALGRVRSLLAPGGMLLLVESTGHHAWHDITTGLIEGWQHFEDDLRIDTPLLDSDTWLSLLSEAGFPEAAAYPQAGSPAEVLKQHLVLAFEGGDVAEVHAVTEATSRETDETAPAEEPDSSVPDFLADAVGSEREEVVTELVRGCVMEVLHSDPERPPARDARLMELGVDSLMAVRLRNLVQERLGLETDLPSTLVFDYPTIRQISALVLETISDGERPGGGRDPETSDQDEDVLEREAGVAALSEEEVEAMLLDRLRSEEL